MAVTLMVLNAPILKVATSQSGLTAGLAVECQVTQARVQATPNYQTVPATGCKGATQSPGLTSFGLNLTWLQDWTVADPGGLSAFAWENDGKEVWFELTPDADDAGTKLTGQAYATAGDFGGTFGDGSAADATATWPCIAKPTIVTP